VRCPSLNELPAPPPGKTGWPWTEESVRVESLDEHVYPRITIVTPSFHQGGFIEETIRSILLQGYPDLEYFILDGGSTDATVEIIQKYSRWITFWMSERDNGQSAAINRGLRLASGVYAGWINSDDMLCKGALVNLASGRKLERDTLYIGDCMCIDKTGNVIFTHRGRVLSFVDLVRIPSIWRSGGSIDQPAAFFPRDLALQVGGLNEANHYTMDYELWGRLLLAGAKVEYTKTPLGTFRWYDGQKTQDSIKQTTSLLDAATILIESASSLSPEVRDELLTELQAYRLAYPKMMWNHSGRLARIGLPRSIVLPIRRVKNTLGRIVGSFHLLS